MTTVTSKGQFTIPKPLRERFGIEPGSRVVLEVRGDTLLCRPLAAEELVQEGDER